MSPDATGTIARKDLQTVESFCLQLLIAWLQTRSVGETGARWVYDNETIGDVPRGYKARVLIELEKIEEVKKFEACPKCKQVKRIGEKCEICMS
jgi:hypothetical protein